MPLLDLDKITKDLPSTWDGYVRNWDRTSARPTARYNYLLSAAQLASYLAEYSPAPDADSAATDPTEVNPRPHRAFPGLDDRDPLRRHRREQAQGAQAVLQS